MDARVKPAHDDGGDGAELFIPSFRGAATAANSESFSILRDSRSAPKARLRASLTRYGAVRNDVARAVPFLKTWMAGSSPAMTMGVTASLNFSFLRLDFEMHLFQFAAISLVKYWNSGVTVRAHALNRPCLHPVVRVKT
jgi:hypothetical protein